MDPTRGFLLTLLTAALAAGCGMGDDAGPLDYDGGPLDNGADAAPVPSLTLAVEGTALPKVGDKVEVSAVVSYIDDPPKKYDWSMTGPADSKATLEENAVGDRISFTPDVPGTFNVSCTVTLSDSDDTILSETAAIQVQESGKLLSYTARIIPSPTSGLPPTDIRVEVGRVSHSGLSWHLDEGKMVNLEVTDSTSQALPVVVRLIQIGTDPAPREFHLPTGKGPVRVNGVFHTLFVPQGGDLPGQLLTNNSASTLQTNWKVALDQGVDVSGTIKRSDGTVLQGAKVTVHTRSQGVTVPSTLAECDGTGFMVHTRIGQASVTVLPPEGSGLPLAIVDDKSLMVSGKTSGWTFSFVQAQPVTITGKVSTSTGTSPAASARVVLMTTLPADVGDLSVNVGAPLPASGLYKRVLATSSSGEMVDPVSGDKQFVAPRGMYQVEVWPGAGEDAKVEGYFLKMMDLTATPAVSLNLKLGARVTLKGQVVDQQGKPVAARVVASADTGSFSTEADSSGKFSMYLNNKATYSLMIRSTQRSVSTYIDPKLTVEGSTQLAPIKLPPAVLLSGKITTSSNLGISGSLVRIWCTGADCPSHEIVDETTVLKDGQFELRVPPTEEK